MGPYAKVHRSHGRNPRRLLVTSFALVTHLGTHSCQKGARLHGGDTGARSAVELVINPPSPTLAVGNTLQLAAVAHFESGNLRDATADADWSSACDAVTVSNDESAKGMLSGVVSGVCDVTATVGDLVASSQVVVNRAGTPALTSLTITAGSIELPSGYTATFAAIGEFADGTTADLTSSAEWTTSSEGSVLRFDPKKSGVAIAVMEGIDEVRVSSNSVEANLVVAVTPATLSEISIVLPLSEFVVGYEAGLNAIGIFSDGSTRDISADVTWTSFDEGVVSMGDSQSPGMASLVGIGIADVAAVSSDVSATVAIRVSESVLSTLSCSPEFASIPLGLSRRMTLDATLSDGQTLDVTSAGVWNSSASTIATISDSAGVKGIVRALEVGNTIVTGRFGGQVASADITSVGATLVELEIVPATITVPPNTSTKFSATGIFSDGSVGDLSEDVTWASSDGTVATVSVDPLSAGLVQPKNAGTAVVSVTLAGLSASASVTVKDVQINSIVISPATAQIAAGFRQQFRATANLSDGSTQDVTEFATWRSLDATIAVVTNDKTSWGLWPGDVLARATGAVSVEAAFGGRYAEAALTVTAATLSSLAIDPDSLVVPLGSTAQLSALGTFSDGTVLDVTSAAVWKSLDSLRRLMGESASNLIVILGCMA